MALLLAVSAPGCGGGHKSAATTNRPQPRPRSEPSAPTTGPVTTTARPTIPEERFKHFCKANPGACS